MKTREQEEGQRPAIVLATGRRQLSLRVAQLALLLQLPDTRRALWLGPSPEASSPLFVLLVPFFVELA